MTLRRLLKKYVNKIRLNMLCKKFKAFLGEVKINYIIKRIKFK